MKRLKLLVVVVSLLIDLLPIPAMTLGGDPSKLEQGVQQPVPPVTTETEGATKITTEKDGPQNNLSYGPTSMRNKTQDDKTRQTQDCTNTESSKWADPITIFTFFVMVFTGLTWWTYHGILRSTKAIERAYVKMSHISQTLTPVNVRDGEVARGRMFRIDMEVKNWGNTPALVTHRFLACEVRPKEEELPVIPDYTKGRLFPVGAFLVKDDSFRFIEILEISEDDLKKCDGAEDTHVCYIFGYVDYIDKFKVRHRAGYARRYKQGIPDFYFVTEPGYNYDREQKKKRYGFCRLFRVSC